ncbi:MAG: hypothetical protein QY318_03500 [Candidatus Dojkabacteria bacterium]|nr:MAG: hypothetical protein QY318_03500 [Candidatus Dojkabacteria bacterium]
MSLLLALVVLILLGLGGYIIWSQFLVTDPTLDDATEETTEESTDETEIEDEALTKDEALEENEDSTIPADNGGI